MVNLVPSADSVMKILTETGAYRRGHFIYPNGKHASHYFQMPLAFRFYDNARILSVGLSRLFRMEKSISSRLPKVSVISPSPGGIMVAFGVREALNAEQIYWAEMEDGKRQFRQYVSGGDIYPAIIVDDILRSGKAMQETIDLVKGMGAEVIGCGAIAKFEDAPNEFSGVPVKSLMSFDVNFYETEEEWKHSRSASESEEEKVRF
ncbi:MAG TPA: phosphoribosyltransferase family protein [Pyrinomonadaceae bacterium]|jgi:orotate phosphoribosyltransferase|nr:phosphoribosyltransferase family protein [Pyrinomonadaceae bacterium]